MVKLDLDIGGNVTVPFVFRFHSVEVVTADHIISWSSVSLCTVA